MNSVKLQDIKINIQEFVLFLYSNNKVAEREIKKILCTIAPKRIKRLGINLAEKVKNLYSKKHKILIRKMKMTKINGNLHQAHGVEELIFLKCL